MTVPVSFTAVFKEKPRPGGAWRGGESLVQRFMPAFVEIPTMRANMTKAYQAQLTVYDHWMRLRSITPLAGYSNDLMGNPPLLGLIYPDW